MPQQMFKLHILLNYAVIPNNVVSEDLIVVSKVVEVNWIHTVLNMIPNALCMGIPEPILPKTLHNHDTVSVHFSHFYCTEICDNLSRDLAMLTYIYLNVDDSRLTSYMH